MATEPHNNLFRSSDFVKTLFLTFNIIYAKEFGTAPTKPQVILASFYKIPVYLQLKLKEYESLYVPNPFMYIMYVFMNEKNHL